MTQYSKRMVIVHWLTLGLLIAAWLLGDAVNEARKEEGATLLGYVVHGLVGGAVLLFTLARLYFRNKDSVPPPLGDTLMDKAAKGIHHALYAALILVPASGAMQIATDFGAPGWGGPCPPAGDKPHRYNFTLHAQKVEKLDLQEGARESLAGYMVNANSIGKARLTGKYGRKK